MSEELRDARDELYQEIQSLRKQLTEAHAETIEQARLLGAGSEREAALLGRMTVLARENAELRVARMWDADGWNSAVHAAHREVVKQWECRTRSGEGRLTLEHLTSSLNRLLRAKPTSTPKLCGNYLGDNDATCPQLTCIRTRGHEGLCDNVCGDDPTPA